MYIIITSLNNQCWFPITLEQIIINVSVFIILQAQHGNEFVKLHTMREIAILILIFFICPSQQIDK